MNDTASQNQLAKKLRDIQTIADELPAVLVIHTVDPLHILYMNRIGLERLVTTLEVLQQLTPEQYFLKYFNNEDSDDYVPKLIHIIKSKTNEQVSYFQQVQVPTQKEWQLYISNTRVFHRNNNGDPTHIITSATLIDPEHHVGAKVNRLVEEVSFFRENTPLFLTLTKREREILTCMALGMNSGEISAKLFISSATADTHRRNVRSKLGLKNNYDAVKFAQAYNLV